MSRSILLLILGGWTLTPLLLLGVVAVSGGWWFPSLLGADPGSGLAAVVPSARLWAAFLTSVGLAAATGVVGSALGILLGRDLARRSGWRRAVGAGCAFLPVAVPPLVIGVGLQYTLLRIGLAGTSAGVLVAHLVPAVGYTALFFMGAFSAFEFGVEEEGRRLGAGPVRIWTRITLPLMRRPLLESFLLAFLVSWAQVPLTLIIGQGRVRTLATEVLSFVQAGQDPLAAAAGLLLTIPPLLLLAMGVRSARAPEVVAA